MDSMNKKITYLLLLLMLIPVGSFAKEKRTFEIKDGHFYVNGKVTPILSGEMHYPRIPHQYWRTPVSTCLCSPRTEAGCSRAVPPRERCLRRTGRVTWRT